MRGATRVKWAVGATAVALAATACGGGSSSGSSGGSGNGVVRASWGDPQNPLEPANTNEVQGGKVLDMIFRGLKKYDPKTAQGREHDRQLDHHVRPAELRHQAEVRLTFSNGQPVTSDSFIDAWNYGALLTNAQLNAYFFSYIDGYAKVHPDAPGATATADHAVGPDEGRPTPSSRSGSTRSSPPGPTRLGYAAFYPLPQAFFTDHAAWLNKPIGNGPYDDPVVHQGHPDEPGQVGRLHGLRRGRRTTAWTCGSTPTTTPRTPTCRPATSTWSTTSRPPSSRTSSPTSAAATSTSRPASSRPSPSRCTAPAGRSAKSAKVRQGLSMAINRKQITQQIFQNTRTPATDWTSPVLGAAGGYKAGLCGAECDLRPRPRPSSSSSRAAGFPAARSPSATTPTPAPTRSGSTRSATASTTSLGNNNACVGAPVGTFADFRNKITNKQMSDPFRAGWQMDYPLIQDFLQPQYYTGRLVERLALQQPELRPAGQPGQRRDRQRERRRRHVPGRGEAAGHRHAGHPAVVPERQRRLLLQPQQRRAEPVQRAGLQRDQGQVRPAGGRTGQQPRYGLRPLPREEAPWDAM